MLGRILLAFPLSLMSLPVCPAGCYACCYCRLLNEPRCECLK
jgi:hypothetical protein